ncbi:MAG: SDR family NAD(P)-dependent oxidoreductase, partial [Alistipes sp.]|nr:SDR family NAD(P)-dependent oxidoreductase [Alistipes sp.]
MKRGEISRGAAWALITGAGSGIGRCYALRLAALGYRVALVGEHIERLDAVKQEIEAAGGGEIRTFAIDLARTTAAQELFDWTREQ